MSLYETSLDQLLERCLQELARTDDVEAALQLYPQHVAQLRPLLEMARMASRCYADVPEAPGGLRAGRERFLSIAMQPHSPKALQTSDADAGITAKQSGKVRLAFAMRLVTVLLTVFIGTAALGCGMAWTARDSLPGDRLYSVKVKTEDARLALALTPEERLGLALQFVGERVEEIGVLVGAGGQVPDVSVTRMGQHIEQVLVDAAWSPEEQMSDMLRQIAVHTLAQAQALERMKSVASQPARAGLERAALVCWRGFAAAESGLSDPQAFRLLYCQEQGTPVPMNVPGLATPTEDSSADEVAPALPSVTPESPRPTFEPHPTAQEQGSPPPTLQPQPTVQEQDPQLTPESQPTPEEPEPALEPQPTTSPGQGQQPPPGQRGPQHPSQDSNGADY